MREVFQTVSGVAAIILDGVSVSRRELPSAEREEPIFIWSKLYVQAIGGQRYLCRTVAYRNTRTRQVRMKIERFGHV